MAPRKITGKQPAKKRWTPEKIESMRRELLNGATLPELAKREGVSHQRISQLVGRVRYFK